MIARAVFSSLPGAATDKRLLGRTPFMALFWQCPSRAAQVPSLQRPSGSTVTIRFRGYSLSDDHPAASAQLSYDDPSGFYTSMSGLAEPWKRQPFPGSDCRCRLRKTNQPASDPRRRHPPLANSGRISRWPGFQIYGNLCGRVCRASRCAALLFAGLSNLWAINYLRRTRGRLRAVTEMAAERLIWGC